MAEKIIPLTTLTYMRAQLLASMLQQNGIPCFLTNINEIKEAPGGVDVMIDEENLETALAILDDFKKNYQKERERAVGYLKSVRRILVPVDFTVHSENAAYYALFIADKLKADIKLVNAYLDPMGAPQTYLESYTYQINIEKVIREIEEEAGKSLEALRTRLKNEINERGLRKTRIGLDLFKGNAVDVILQEIEDYRPGLVVIGTRGSELEGFRAFGSVTAHLIQKSHVPVLAIPKSFDSMNFRPPKNVLYATNFNTSDFDALHRLVNFVKPFNAKIYCVHAAFEEAGEMDEAQLRRIKTYLFQLIDTYHIECGLLETYDIQQGIEDFIEEHNIDVLAMTTRKRNFITRLFQPSMTKKFLFQTNIPLLVFQSLQ